MTLRLLVTGFEPFGGSSINPSEQVVRRLAAEPPQGVDLCTAVLPVDRQRGPAMLLQKVNEAAPQAVVCLGEASRRAALSIERLAVNLLDFRIPDNQGTSALDEPVVPGGPPAYFSTLPVRTLLQAALAAQVPAELSLSAGSYLCNQVFYTFLDHLAEAHLTIPAGFIHLPSLPEQASLQKPPGPSLSLDTSLRGIRAVIAALAEGLLEAPAPEAVQPARAGQLAGLTLRRATIHDLETLVEMRLALHREVGALPQASSVEAIVSANRRYIEDRLPAGDFKSWVAELDGRLVACSGLVIYHRPPNPGSLSSCEAYIMNVYTRPEWRGRGIASALMLEILNYARSQGARRAWLRATHAGRPLYQKLGFQPMQSAMELILTQG